MNITVKQQKMLVVLQLDYLHAKVREGEILEGALEEAIREEVQEVILEEAKEVLGVETQEQIVGTQEEVLDQGIEITAVLEDKKEFILDILIVKLVSYNDLKGVSFSSFYEKSNK